MAVLVISVQWYKWGVLGYIKEYRGDGWAFIF